MIEARTTAATADGRERRPLDAATSAETPATPRILTGSAVENKSSFTMNIKPVEAPRRDRKALRNPNPATRAKLMGAAAELLAADGFPELRIEEVARRAGTSVGTLYLYFDGKADLFVQLVLDFTDRLRTRLNEAAVGDGTVGERLAGRLDTYLDFVEENERGFLYFRDAGTVDTTVGRLSTWAVNAHAEDLQPLLREAMANGEFRTTDPVLLSHAIVALSQHLAGHWLEHRDSCSRADVQRFMDAFVAFGVAPRSLTSPPGHARATSAGAPDAT